MTDTQYEKIENLLMPISDEQPCGIYIKYKPVSRKLAKLTNQSLWYDAIENAMHADVYRINDSQVPDWKLVLQCTNEILLSHSKDLQIACWYGVALIFNDSQKFLSVRDGLYLINKLVERYWAGLHPGIQPDDESETDYLDNRAGILRRHDSSLSTVLLSIPLFEPQTQGSSDKDGVSAFYYNLENYLKVNRKSVSRDNADPDNTQSEYKNDYNWHNAAKSTHPNDIDHALQCINDSLELVEELNGIIEQLYQHDAPTLYHTQKTLHSMVDVIEQYSPPTVSKLTESAINIATRDDQVSVISDKAVPSASTSHILQIRPGLPVSRKEMFAQLNEISNYFKIHEPHSPVSYLIDRAIKWGNISLNDWLREAFADNEDAARLAKRLEDLLGINQDN